MFLIEQNMFLVKKLTYFKPIVGSGLFVYSDNFFVSFSFPNFLKNSLDGEDNQIIYNYKSPFFQV